MKSKEPRLPAVRCIAWLDGSGCLHGKPEESDSEANCRQSPAPINEVGEYNVSRHPRTCHACLGCGGQRVDESTDHEQDTAGASEVPEDKHAADADREAQRNIENRREQDAH